MRPEESTPTLPRYASWLRDEERMLRREYDECSNGALIGVFDRVAVSSIYPPGDFDGLGQAIAGERCRQFAYSSAGQQVSGYLVLPEKIDEPRPAIIYARGGNRSFGAVDTGALLNLLALADAGYVVAATQYRGGPGSSGADELGGADVHDLLTLAALVCARPDVDERNLFLWGVSRGGMMSMQALRQGVRPNAVALRAPMLDLEDIARRRPEMRTHFADLMPDYSDDPVGALEVRSALAWPELLPDVPILTLHGEFDGRVSVTQSLRFDEVLHRLGRTSACHVYRDDAHLLLLNRIDYLRRVREWFDAYVVG